MANETTRAALLSRVWQKLEEELARKRQERKQEQQHLRKQQELDRSPKIQRGGQTLGLDECVT